MIRLCTAVLFALLSSTTFGQSPILTLDTGWEFSQPDSSIWRAAEVPGCVHTDLMRHGMPDPFVGQGEKSWEWVSASDWVYRCTFHATMLKSLSAPILVFDGLDTHAKVLLNGQEILVTDNAFHPWEADVAGLLKRKRNVLEIHFSSPLVVGERLAAASRHPLPGAPIRAVSRKPQYQYGWDWGPTLPSMGITGDITLVDRPHAHQTSFSVSTVSATQKLAELHATIEVEAKTEASGWWSLTLDGVETRIPVKLQVGANTIEHTIGVANPKLWWPREMGQQHLYALDSHFQAGQFEATQTKHIGIRTAELDTTDDEQGARFVVRVNGYTVFAKGANYIPQDVFLNRVTEANYKHLIDQCVAANMNMLRVWGGGIYEQEYFYTLCDEAGIMVWQDFMFACAMYPGDDAFIQNLTQEATYQIKRLENHPCMVMWCGNNENSEGWHRWGWQAGLTETQIADTWRSYERVFQELLPTLVASFSTLPYWESSPSLGRGDERFRFQGDAHDWTVWHDAAPFERFRSHVPRFMSEFGFQALPSMEILEQMSLENIDNTAHQDLAAHQKHHRGFALVDEYMLRDFGRIPENLSDYAYLSQVQQARGMGMGMQAHRSAAPYCMGSLYWQLNDCWPAVSWSSLDVDGNWKAMHYAAMHAFEPYTTDVWVEDTTLYVKAVLPGGPDFSRVETLRGRVNIQSLEGEYLSMIPLQVRGLPGHAVTVLEFPLKRMTEGDAGINNLAVTVQLNSGYGNLRETHFTGQPKDWNLEKSPINVQTEQVTGDSIMVTLTCAHFAYGVMLSADAPGHFTDNFILLRPGEPQRIYFRRQEDGGVPAFTARSLADVLK